MTVLDRECDRDRDLWTFQKTVVIFLKKNTLLRRKALWLKSIPGNSDSLLDDLCCALNLAPE
jgi:hypothetical protein